MASSGTSTKETVNLTIADFVKATETYHNEPLENIFLEWLLGHQISPSKAAYYKANPEELRDYYSQFVHELSIKDVEVMDKTPEQIKQIVRENQERAK